MLHIPVEWIRELNHSVSRGTIKGKTNVAIICDVDIMQAASANAMLKTLEEPPPDSLILLLTKRPHAVLPTIRSRCQIIRFGWISPGAMAHSLCKEYSLDSDTPDIKHAVACADGSYSKAKLLIEESLDIFAGQANALWQLCLKESSFNNNVITALEILVEDYLGIGKDYAACEKLLIAFLHIIRSTFFRSIGDTENYINKLSTHEISNSGLCAESIEKLFAECEKAISAIRARGNILLVLTTFIMSVMEIIHGEKYEIS